MSHTHIKAVVASGVITSLLAGTISVLVMGVDPLAPFSKREESFIAVPHAHAWGGSTWRRIRREARRARDRIRKALEQARQQAEREAKRALTRAREGDLRVNLDSLDDRALQYLTTASNITAPFLPVSQIVSMSLATLDYERVVKEMEALEMDQSDINRAQQQLDAYEATLGRLESVQVDGNVRIGLVPPPAGTVQSAEEARVQYEQLGEYLAILVFESAFYEQVQGEMPRRRPVTLIYKIGQGLLDYAQLTADIRLIADSQPEEHTGLYDEIVTRGTVGSVVTLLRQALTYLETMPVSGLPDPAISPTSRVGRLLTDVDNLLREGDRIIAEEYASPLMVPPTSMLASMDAKLLEITHSRRRSETAWILLLPQHEVDALEEARGRLQRKRDQVAQIHVYTPQELVSRYFLEAIILWPRYQQLGTESGTRAATVLIEIREIRSRMQNAVNTVQTQHLPYPQHLLTTAQDVLRQLQQAETDLTQRTASFLQETVVPFFFSSSSSSSSPVPVATSSTSTQASMSRRTRPSLKDTLRRKPFLRRGTIVPSKDVVPRSSPTVSTKVQEEQQSTEKSSAAQSATSVSSISIASSAAMSVSSTERTVPTSSSTSVNTTKTMPSALPAPRLTDPTETFITVTKPTIDIYGLVDNRTQKLLVNGEPASSYTPTAGKFWITVKLVVGKNVIDLQAMDANSTKSATTTLTVMYNPWMDW